MRILVVSPVTPYLPSHDGARAVVAHLVRSLAPVHAVGLVSATTAADTPEQRQWSSGLCAWTRLVSAGRWRHPLSLQPAEGVSRLREAMLEALRDFAPDVLHLEGSELAPLARVGGRPSVLVVRDSDTLPATGERRRAHNSWGWIDRLDEWQQAAWEHAWFERADVVLTGDAVPIGIDLDHHEFRRTGQSGRIVFIADLARPAASLAAERYAVSIFPRVRVAWPRAELVLSGGDPARSVRALGTLPGVRVTGVMPDLRPTLWGAAVAVPTTRAGLLEAMALGTPVVASSRTAAAVSDVVAGRHALIADDDDATAEALLAVVRDPDLAERLARAARTLVEDRHGWAVVARHYDAIWRRLQAVPAGLSA
jgi:glycosyltransferase involved in cell wall biosynthesis